MKTAHYHKTAKDNGYWFYITPAPKVVGGCAGVFLILMMAFMAALILGSLSVAILPELAPLVGFVVFLTFLILGIVKWDMRKKNHRHSSSFFVNPQEIQINSQTISRESIHRVIIRNAYENDLQIIYTGQPIPTGVGMGIDIKHMLQQISFSVNVEAGGRAIQLAGGMDQVCAYGLLMEVAQILNLKVD